MRHADILLSFMSGLFEERVGCDVVLVTGHGAEIHVHKVVLTAYSNYFAHRFGGKSNMRTMQKEWIDLTNINGAALVSLIECLYTGRLAVSKPDEIHLILTVARQLQISTVISICQGALDMNDRNDDGNVEFKNESLPVLIKTEGHSDVRFSVRDFDGQQIISKTNRTYVENAIAEISSSTVGNDRFVSLYSDELIRTNNYSRDLELTKEMNVIELNGSSVRELSLGVSAARESIGKSLSRKPASGKVCDRKTDRCNGQTAKRKVTEKSKSSKQKVLEKSRSKRNASSRSTDIDEGKNGKTISSKIKEKKIGVARKKNNVKVDPSVCINKKYEKKEEGDVSCPLRKSGRKRKLAINETENKSNAVDVPINKNHSRIKKRKLLNENSHEIKDEVSTDAYDYPVESPETLKENERKVAESELSDRERPNLNSNNAPYICTLCSVNFNDKLALNLHSTTEHNILLEASVPDSSVSRRKVSRWACLEAGCGAVLKTSVALKEHMMEQHPNVMYTCKQCKYHTTSRRLMEKHDRHRHKNDLDKTCDLCKKAFSSKYFYKIHMRMKHDIIDPTLKVFECAVEGCRFFSPHISNLRKHEIKHQIDKPFCCDVCGKRIKTEQYVACQYR